MSTDALIAALKEMYSPDPGVCRLHDALPEWIAFVRAADSVKREHVYAHGTLESTAKYDAARAALSAKIAPQPTSELGE